jgi:pimeloyl-ACP methyl ester carboxylesterase
MILKLSEGVYPRVERGEGRPVVMLHGMFGSPDNWLHQIENLSRSHRMIVLELPIFDEAWDDPSVEGLTRYALEYLDWAGFERAVFVGNSLGGHIALYLACHHPERVRALVLSGSSGLLERGYEQGLPTNPGHDWIYGRVAQVFFDERTIRPGMVDEVTDFLDSRRNKFRLVKVAKAAKRTHMGPDLHRVTAPTLLVWGRQDEVTPLEVAHEFNEGIENSRLVLFDECGHAPMMEKPEEFTEVLGDFLAGLS